MSLDTAELTETLITTRRLTTRSRELLLLPCLVLTVIVVGAILALEVVVVVIVVSLVGASIVCYICHDRGCSSSDRLALKFNFIIEKLFMKFRDRRNRISTFNLVYNLLVLIR